MTGPFGNHGKKGRMTQKVERAEQVQTFVNAELAQRAGNHQ